MTLFATSCSASKAKDMLGFDVSPANVKFIRNFLGMPANGRPNSAKGDMELIARIQFLEAQMETLRLWLHETFPNKGPKL